MKKLIYPLLVLFVLSANSQNSSVRMYAFGHSLIDHATSSEYTNIMYWINDISQEAGNSFATGGQYGFLPTHDDLPPSSNWGYNGITSVWDSSTEPFSDANINTILITAANFIQYVFPTSPHPLDNSTTVIQSTETIFDWVNTQEPNAKYYIYANWPEMDLQSAYPPTLPLQSEIDDFHNLTLGSFADWWIEYQDNMATSRPQLNTRLIPVGMIISKILTDVIPNPISFDNLYEDSAPHGKASIYFLAGMITYMAIYEENIPSTYAPNTNVHVEIRNNIESIRNFAWNELLNFNFQNGDSRVFYSNSLNTENFTLKNLVLYPNPTDNYFNISNSDRDPLKLLLYNNAGAVIKKLKINDLNKKIDIRNIAKGVYFIHIENINTQEKMIKKLIIK